MEVGPRAFELDRGSNGRDATFNAYDVSRVLHPFFPLERKHDVDIELRARGWRFREEQQRAGGAYVAKNACLDKAVFIVFGGFNSYLPIHLKPLRSSAFNQRASKVLQTDCMIDDLLHCCFTASFDKLKLKIDVVVLDERINCSGSKWLG